VSVFSLRSPYFTIVPLVCTRLLRLIKPIIKLTTFNPVRAPLDDAISPTPIHVEFFGAI
jgi:hypothetical protein